VKKSLPELDEKIFLKIFPFLKQITNAMGIQLMEQSLAIKARETENSPPSPVSSAPTPAPTAAVTPPTNTQTTTQQPSTATAENEAQSE
jgi:hypothetical protein